MVSDVVAQILPPVITVEEMWPYALAAGGIISTLSGIIYATLLQQIRELKEDKRLLQQENNTQRETIAGHTRSMDAITVAVRELGNSIDRFSDRTPEIRRGRAT